MEFVQPNFHTRGCIRTLSYLVKMERWDTTNGRPCAIFKCQEIHNRRCVYSHKSHKTWWYVDSLLHFTTWKASLNFVTWMKWIFFCLVCLCFCCVLLCVFLWFEKVPPKFKSTEYCMCALQVKSNTLYQIEDYVEVQNNHRLQRIMPQIESAIEKMIKVKYWMDEMQSRRHWNYVSNMRVCLLQARGRSRHMSAFPL